MDAFLQELRWRLRMLIQVRNGDIRNTLWTYTWYYFGLGAILTGAGFLFSLFVGASLSTLFPFLMLTVLFGAAHMTLTPALRDIESQRAAASQRLLDGLKGTVTTYKVYTIALPPNTQWQPQQAHDLVVRMLSYDIGLFRILAEAGSIRWQVISLLDLATEEDLLTGAIQAVYPEAEITVAPFTRPPFSEPFYRSTVLFHQLQPNYLAPLATPKDLKDNDPLISFTNRLSNLQPGERVEYLIYAGEPNPQFNKHGKMFVSTHGSVYALHGILDMIFGGSSGSSRSAPSREQNILSQKLNDTLLPAFVVLQFDAVNEQNIAHPVAALNDLVVSLQLFSSPHQQFNQMLTFMDVDDYSGPITTDEQAWQTSALALIAEKIPTEDKRPSVPTAGDHMAASVGGVLAPARWVHNLLSPKLKSGPRCIFSPNEIAALWHLPYAAFTAPAIRWASHVPSQVVDPEQTGEIIIGTVEPNLKVRISRFDRRYHAFVSGQTGMGKSTMLHNLIHQDIASGQGLVVLDPHGSLTNKILQTSIDQDRLDDVVFLRCADPDYPVPLNPFRAPPGVASITVFNTALWVMKSIYKDGWSATRMETVIRNILQVILNDPEATPLDIQELVGNPNYRRRVLKQMEGKLSRSAKNFWRNFEDLSPSEQKNQTQSVLSRLTAFLGSPHVELMTCHPHTLDFRQLIRQRKIVLVDLAGDEVVSEVGTLGAIFLAQFFLASLSLGEIPGDDPPRFYLYMDETRRFITTALPDMFAESRKFGLSLTLATQYIGQLDEETRDDITNNVGTKISFECSPAEARATAKLYEPHVTQDQMTRLGVGRAALRTRWQGETLNGFVVKAQPAPEPLSTQLDVAALVQRSRDNLGLIARQAVEDWLDQRYESGAFSPQSDEPELSDFD